MGYRIEITDDFERDLDSVLDYISNNLYSPDSARKLLKSTREKLTFIADDPLLYPIYHDEKLAEKGYHYAVLSNYLIFYRIDEITQTIFISRFLYGGQNISDEIFDSK